jgi:hypothetical protein
MLVRTAMVGAVFRLANSQAARPAHREEYASSVSLRAISEYRKCTASRAPQRSDPHAAGKLAKAEQERLALEYRLRDGRRPQTEDPGVFSADKGRAGLQEPSPCTNTPPP